jgi:hypothetical protein
LKTQQIPTTDKEDPKMQTAKVIALPTPEPGYQQNPGLVTRTRGKGREIAVAKFRELADKLESGELDGARVQWLDTHGECLENDGAQISGMEFVTRTAWREDGSGTVQLVSVTIEEEG